MLLTTLGASVAVGGCAPTGPTEAEALLDVLSFEDRRPLNTVDTEALASRTGAEDVATRRFAVRALGRLEDPTLLARIEPLLVDPDPGVRATAAWAMAQAVHGGEGAPAVSPLLSAARTETDPNVRAEIARSLGRTRPEAPAADEVVALLADWAAEPALPAETAVGVALGLEGLTRSTGPAASSDRVYQTLSTLFGRAGRPGNDPTVTARVRAVALLGLGQRGRATAANVVAALQDPSPAVRATGARFLSSVDIAQRTALEAAALEDEAAIVRVEALRAVAAADRTPGRCERLLEAASRNDLSSERLVAIDALSIPCPDPMGEDAQALLESLAGAIPGGQATGWHPSIHALAALARLSPADARAFLPAHVGHPNPFVRAQAAATAAEVSDIARLRILAADPDPNVRTAALPALFELEGRNLDATLVRELSGNDAQILLTVSGLLQDTNHDEAATAALEAFERISALERETARDARISLLELLGRVGDAELTARLAPYVRDYDAMVADRVATLLTGWTGETWSAEPEPLPRLPLPSSEDVERMAEIHVVLHMARGGAIVVEPLPFLAPTNAQRFVRLAQEGHFEGLTFHRVVPNFVIQGGSVAANEYTGDGPYTRDEIGRLSHWRGTVGLSTRGRDTGDGQIFVNLVDNIRLDHDYTLFGQVVSGMETVDSVLAGDVIERVEIRPED